MNSGGSDQISKLATDQASKGAQNTSLENQMPKILLYGVGFSVISIGIYFTYQHLILPRLNKAAYKSYKLAQAIQQMRNHPNSSVLQLKIKSQQLINQDSTFFLFTLLEGLDQKPQTFNPQKANPFLPPFGVGIFVSQIGPKHNLLFNGYAVINNHMLVCTQKFEKQGEILTKQDFVASAEVVKALDGFMFFNSGAQSGASQPHRHLQIMPAEGGTDLLKELRQRAAKQTDPFQFEKFKFQHVIVPLKSLKETFDYEAFGTRVYEGYIDSLQFLQHESNQFQYNLILSDNFLMMVPRRKEKAFDILTVNATGFIGSFLFQNEQQIEEMDKYSPFAILNDITFPDDEQVN